MDEKRIWTIQDIAGYTGYTRAHINAQKREIPATRLKRGPCRFRYNAEFGKWLEMMKKKKTAGPQRVRPSRAGRNSRRRQQKIDKLEEIFGNGTELSEKEKKLAICFIECLYELHQARYGYSRRPILSLLLQGIEAHCESRTLEFFDLPAKIERLPTCSET